MISRNHITPAQAPGLPDRDWGRCSVKPGSVTVVICTRDRPALLAGALRALAQQRNQHFEILIVAQGEPPGPDTLQRAGTITTRMFQDSGTGVSRARNLGFWQAASEWIVYVDDDCRLAPDWIDVFEEVRSQHPECSFVRGEVTASGAMPTPYLPVAVMRARRQRTMRGRRRAPLSIGHHVCFAVRRETVAALGGWDERLGHGVLRFPGAADEDFNYRFLRAGESALIVPRLRASHEQWRTQDELPPLFRGYMIGRGAVAAKHARSGDRNGGAWLGMLVVRDCLILTMSALVFRSRLRARIATASWRGVLSGLMHAWNVDW